MNLQIHTSHLFSSSLQVKSNGCGVGSCVDGGEAKSVLEAICGNPNEVNVMEFSAEDLIILHDGGMLQYVMVVQNINLTYYVNRRVNRCFK
jgi:hypothetical protein